MVARLTATLSMVYDCSDSLLSAVRLALLANYNVMPVSPAVAPVKVLLLAFLFVQENFVLVFDELTIMVLTYSLALRFRQLNAHLQKVCRQVRRALGDTPARSTCRPALRVAPNHSLRVLASFNRYSKDNRENYNGKHRLASIL